MVNVTKHDMYLDHAAATPCDSEVVAAMAPYFSDEFFNPSSPYAPAVVVRRNYEAAKHKIASTFGAKADEIIITAGATESINIAMTASKGGHIVTSSIEHLSVLEAVKNYDYTLAAVNKKGIVDIESIASQIRPNTMLVSIALANNELGTIQPLSKIASIIEQERHRRLADGEHTPIWLHSDASQGAGLIDISPSRLGVDLLTLNAAKLYGPKQVGLLWKRPSVVVYPLVYGGGQEAGIRNGTENIAGTIGFARAIELSYARRKGESQRLSALKNITRGILEEQFHTMIVSGDSKRQLPSFLHISFPGLDAERLIFRLESRDVFVATGSACSANKGTESHVLRAIGLDTETINGSIRLSFGKCNNEESVKKAAGIIAEEVAKEYERLKS